MFRQIKGQHQVIELLTTQIANDRVAQAYLFHGRDGVGKFLTALYFGMGLNCLSINEYRPCGVCSSCKKFLSFEHSDFIYLFPSTNLQISVDGEIKNSESQKQYFEYLDNKINRPWLDYKFSGALDIRRDSMQYLLKRLELSISEAKYRIVIIEDADKMNLTTANNFLKRLEEPPYKTVIILITEKLSMLLPTIVSRCQQVYFKPLSTKTIEMLLVDKFECDLAIARSAAKISNGNFKEAAKIIHSQANSVRELAFEIFELAQKRSDLVFYNILTKNKDLFNAETAIELIRFISMIANDVCVYNTNPELISNIDKVDVIDRAANGTPDIADKMLEFLIVAEDLSRRISGNVNLQLIMIKLYHSLLECFD